MRLVSWCVCVCVDPDAWVAAGSTMRAGSTIKCTLTHGACVQAHPELRTLSFSLTMQMPSLS